MLRAGRRGAGYRHGPRAAPSALAAPSRQEASGTNGVRRWRRAVRRMDNQPVRFRLARDGGSIAQARPVCHSVCGRSARHLQGAHGTRRRRRQRGGRRCAAARWHRSRRELPIALRIATEQPVQVGDVLGWRDRRPHACLSGELHSSRAPGHRRTPEPACRCAGALPQQSTPEVCVMRCESLSDTVRSSTRERDGPASGSRRVGDPALEP